jgi:hypothetical protein
MEFAFKWLKIWILPWHLRPTVLQIVINVAIQTPARSVWLNTLLTQQRKVNARSAPSIVTNATIRILVEFACQGISSITTELVPLAQLIVKAAHPAIVASCPSNCADCSDGNTCTQCLIGYALTNGSCQRIVCSETCLECSDNTTCTRCAVGFYLNSADNSCAVCSSHCTSCFDGAICGGCTPGYSLAFNGSCHLECPVNCGSCSGPQFTCSNCSSGFQLINISNLTICSVSGS